MKITESARLIKAIATCKVMMRSRVITPPYRLTMNITNQCNSRCLTCNAWQTYKDNPTGLQHEMHTDEIDKILKSLPGLLWFQIGGGEPFLRKDFTEIVGSAAQNCKSLIVIDTSTNGLLSEQIERTTIEILENIHRPLFTVGVSLDGTPEINDGIRGIPGGWHKTLETYQRLLRLTSRYANFAVHINYTISGYNTGRMKEFLELLESESIKPQDVSVSLAHQGVAFSHNDYEKLKIVDIEKATRDLELLSAHYRFQGFSTAQASRLFKRIFLKLAPRYLNQPGNPVIPCASGSASCFIDPYGDVFPCTIWTKKMGNIRETNYNFNQLWRSSETRLLRTQIKAGLCPNCWSGCESWTSILEQLPWSMRYLVQSSG